MEKQKGEYSALVHILGFKKLIHLFFNGVTKIHEHIL